MHFYGLVLVRHSAWWRGLRRMDTFDLRLNCVVGIKESRFFEMEEVFAA